MILERCCDRLPVVFFNVARKYDAKLLQERSMDDSDECENWIARVLCSRYNLSRVVNTRLWEPGLSSNEEAVVARGCRGRRNVVLRNIFGGPFVSWLRKALVWCVYFAWPVRQDDAVALCMSRICLLRENCAEGNQYFC